MHFYPFIAQWLSQTPFARVTVSIVLAIATTFFYASYADGSSETSHSMTTTHGGGDEIYPLTAQSDVDVAGLPQQSAALSAGSLAALPASSALGYRVGLMQSLMRRLPAQSLFKVMWRKATRYLLFVGSGAMAAWYMSRKVPVWDHVGSTVFSHGGDASSSIGASEVTVRHDPSSLQSQENPNPYRMPPSPPGDDDAFRGLEDVSFQESSEDNKTIKNLDPEVRDFFETYLDKHYYDAHNDTRVNRGFHPELSSLMKKLLALKSVSHLRHLMQSLRDGGGKSFFKERNLSIWTLESLKDFMMYQLTSYKELHVFLRILFASSSELYLVRLPSLERHYETSKEDLIHRNVYIKDLMKSYNLGKEPRLKPIQAAFSTKLQVIKAIEAIPLKDLHARLQRVLKYDEESYLINNMHLITQKRVAAFFQSLSTPTERRIFIEDFLHLSDTLPQSTARRNQLIFKIRSGLHYFIHSAETKKDQQNVKQYMLDSKETLKRFDGLGEKDFQKALSNMRYQARKAFSINMVKQIKKEDVKKFIRHQLKDDLSKEIFFLLVLKIQDTPILEYSDKISMSALEIAKMRNVIVQNFIEYLARLYPSIREGIKPENAELYSEVLYKGMSDQQILYRIKNAKILEDYHLETLPYFNIETINKYTLHYLMDSCDWVRFYMYFLQVQTATNACVGAMLDLSEHSLISKVRWDRKILLHMLSRGNIPNSYSKNIAPYDYGIKDYKDLLKLYERLHKKSFHIVKERLANQVNNLNTHSQNVAASITPGSTQHFFEVVVDSPVKKHIFLSLILRLDQSSNQTITDQSGLPYNVIYKTKVNLVKKLDRFLRSGNKMTPHSLKSPLSLPSSISSSADIQAWKGHYKSESFHAHSVSELKKYFLKPQNNKNNMHDIDVEKIQVSHIQKFITHVLGDNDIKWLVYLGRVLDVENFDENSYLKQYNINDVEIFQQQRKMINDLVDIVHGYYTPPVIVSHKPDAQPKKLHDLEPLKLEELWEIYDSLPRISIAKKLSNKLERYDPAEDILPYINQDSLKRYVVDVLKNHKKNPLDLIKERLFLSVILQLDDYSLTDIAREFNYSNFDHLKRLRSEIEMDLIQIIKKDNAIIYRIQPSPTSDMLSKLERAKQQYKLLSEEVILERIKQSYIFKKVEFSKQFLTASAVNAFIDTELNHKRTMATSQVLWHVFFCAIVEVCDVAIKELVRGYQLSGDNRIAVYKARMKSALLNAVYLDSEELRDYLKENPQDTPFFTKPYHGRDSQGQEGGRQFSTVSYFPTGLLKSDRLFDVEELKKSYFAEDDSFILGSFQNSYPISSAFNNHFDHSQITLEHIEIFFATAIKDPRQWLVFFCLVISWGKCSGHDIASYYNMQHHDSVLLIQELLIFQLQHIVQNHSAQETFHLEKKASLEDMDLDLWRMKRQFKGSSDRDIWLRFLDLHHHKGVGDSSYAETVAQLSDDQVALMSQKLFQLFEDKPYRWHIFLALIMDLSHTKVEDLARIYHISIGRVYTVRSVLKKSIITIITKHLKVSPSDEI